MDQIASTRVYKKTSANSVLTLYLGSRDLVSRHGIVEPLRGVIYLDPKFMCSQKIYGQLTLTFRYGREDEEVMGLKFCNEAVIAIKQIWPRVNYNEDDDVTPLQQALVDRLGIGAHPFTLEIGMLAPPSVQLLPAKKYNGAPIGTSYDIRIFMSDITDEKFLRRTTVKLGIRLMHKIPSDARIIQQNNPTYTSLPKTIRLRLSPKQLKFYHHKNHQNSKSSTAIDIISTTTTTTASTATPPPTSQLQNSKQKLTTTTTTVTSTLPNETKIYNNKIDNEPIATISAGGTIRLPNAPTATANVATHPLTLGDSSSTIICETDSKIVVGINKSTVRTMENSNVTKGPERFIDKPFLWTEGRVSLKASLNKSAYKHGENVLVTVNIKNNSKKIVRKIRVFAVQHVDVCMFSNGKFKNVVADVDENHQIKPNESHLFTYNLMPLKGATKNWIAVEGTFSQGGSIGDSPTHSLFKIASSAHRGPTTADDRNVFAIYVSYYVKVKLTLSGMGGEVSLKLPFILGYVDDGNDSDDDDDDIDENDDTSNSDTEDNNDGDDDRNSKRRDGNSGDSYDIQKKHDCNNDDNDKENNQSLHLNDQLIDKNNSDDNTKNDSDLKKKLPKRKSIESTVQKISVKNIIEEELLVDQDSIFLENDDDNDDDDGDHDNYKHRKNSNLNTDENIATNSSISSSGSSNHHHHQENSIDLMKKSKDENDEEKFIKDKNLLHKYKLKRSSYSRSCEDIETFSRSDDVKINNNNNSNNNSKNSHKYNNNNNNKNDIWCDDDIDDDDDDEEDENSGDEGFLTYSRALFHRHSIETNG